MKNILVTILAVIMLTFATTPVIHAENTTANIVESHEIDSLIEYFDDGSYLITTITTTTQSSVTRSTSYTKIGEKRVDYYDSDDNPQWTYKLIGRFNVVEGVSAVCTESTYSSEVYAKGWSLTAHNNYTSSNIAYGTATYKKKVLFITTNTHDIEGSIGCDIYGNVG